MSEDPEHFRKSIVVTALGRERADLVIENSTLVNVYSGELVENTDVAVKENRIALVGDAGHTIGENTRVLDVEGNFLAPGFLDGHVHIDDSLGTVTEFAKVVLPKGSTCIFMDPHEIANVLGLKGVRLMVEEAETVPLRVYTCIPSCVPAASPEFETTGGQIGPKEVEEALGWDSIIALGEVMDYPSVLQNEEAIHKMIRKTLSAGKVVEGHAPGLMGERLNAYIGAGISSCHESTEREEALEKLRLGVYPMIREGFASIKNLSKLIRIVTERDVDTNRISLATDDRHPEDLLDEGHMDHVIRRAIEEGVDPIEAIQMGTINTATHFRVDDRVGGISPGRFADMVVFEDLENISANEVIADGKIVATDGELVREFDPYEYPRESRNTVRLPRKLEEEDFELEAPSEGDSVEVRVIGVDEDSPTTQHLKRELTVRNDLIETSVNKDIAKVAVVERHKETGNIGLGFVNGFGFKEGATASTISHDSHNLLVVGMNEEDMVIAANRLSEVGGGIITVREGEILSLLKLPIAGLMSSQSLEETRSKMVRLSKTWNQLGCEMDFPFPTLILLTLPVLPELRITDKGLIDTVSFEKVDLIMDPEF